MWERPLLVFGTKRDDGDARPPPFERDDTVELKLRGLRLADVEALASWTTGREISEVLARALLERTMGTPFFLEQILGALADEDRLDELPDELPLPLDVEAAVQARLDALPSHEREAIKHAAVFRRPFASEDLEALGVEHAASALDALAKRGLVRRRAPRPVTGADGDELRSRPRAEHELRSALVADVAYRLMTDGARAGLHLRAARIVSARPDPDAEDVARHFELGGSPVDAAHAYVRAALTAARHRDTERVLHCAERAIALGVADEDRFALHMARSDAYGAEGRGDAQRDAIEAAVAEAASPEERAAALGARALSRMRVAGPADAIEDLEDAVRAANESSDPVVQARSLGQLATALVYAAELDRAAGILGEAELLVATRAPALRADAASWRAQLAGAQGDLGARRNAYRAAVELYRAAGDLRNAAGAAVNLADAFNRFGAYAEAEAALREALEQCQRLRLDLMAGYAELNLGYSLHAQAGGTELAERDRKLHDAGAAIDAAAAIASRIGDARLALFARLYRGRVRLSAGAIDGAVEDGAHVAREAAPLGLSQLGALGGALEAGAELERGRTARALELSEGALRLRHELGGLEEDEAEVFLAHARALEAAGRTDEAAHIRDEGLRAVEVAARRIGDSELRDRFLTVAANRELRGSGTR